MNILQRLRSLRALRVKLFILVITGILSAQQIAYADTNSQMDAFWTGSMGTATVTGPTAYKGQSAGYYTGGNLSWRAPQQSIQIASLQVPSISAGCGGIDVFTGGFSFINADALVAEMKGIMSSAVGFAFNLALKLLVPSVHDIMTNLQHFAQMANGSQKNSCQLGAALANTFRTQITSAAQSACETIGAADGQFPDQVAASAKCAPNPSAVNSSDPTIKAADPTQANIAWQAIKTVSGLGADPQFAQLLMTLTGTLVINCGSGTPASTGCPMQWIPPSADEASLLTSLLDGGDVKVVQCDDQDVCLNPLVDGLTITIQSQSAFKSRVSGYISDIIARIGSRTAITPEEQTFLGMTPVPVLKMATVYVTAQGGNLAAATLDQYADNIATITACEFIKEVMRKVQTGAHNLQNINLDQLKQWSEQASAIKRELTQREVEASSEQASTEAMVARTQAVEMGIKIDASTRFANTAAFLGQH